MRVAAEGESVTVLGLAVAARVWAFEAVNSDIHREIFTRLDTCGGRCKWVGMGVGKPI